MSNYISRRDWLKLIGGSAAGLVLTPIPWKILDESAKWTQNWSWTPVPKNGRFSFKYSSCALCPMACGVRIRCVGDRAVSICGIPRHPLSDGAICELGIAGHLLRYHPSRLLRPFKKIADATHSRLVPISTEIAAAEIASLITSTSPGSVAILDSQPRRTVSYLYRRFLAGFPNATYITPHSTSGLPTRLTNFTMHTGEVRYGYNIAGAKTILSFGTPVLDSWGTPGQLRAIAGGRTASADDRLRIIQVESVRSRSAQLADEWIPIRPGTEGTFALGLANVIISEKLCDLRRLGTLVADFEEGSRKSFAKLVQEFSPSTVAAVTGVEVDRILSTARTLAARKPSVVVFGGNPASGPFPFEDQVSMMDLNVLLGAVGSNGKIVPVGDVPAPFDSGTKLVPEKPLEEVREHSIRLLILDGADSGDAIPWNLIKRKMIDGESTVVSLAPNLAGLALHADYLIPSPCYLETAMDVPTPASASFVHYSVGNPVCRPPEGAVDPIDLLKMVASSTKSHHDPEFQTLTTQKLIERRIEKIYSGGEGYVFQPESGKSQEISSLSRTDFKHSMIQGSSWFNKERHAVDKHNTFFLGNEGSLFDRMRSNASLSAGSGRLILIPVGCRGVGTAAQENSLMAKLYRESDLRREENVVSMNPKTAELNGMTDNSRATIKTETGAIEVTVRKDKSVMPGILEASVAPAAASFDRIQTQTACNVLDICRIGSDSTWRITPAEIKQA